MSGYFEISLILLWLEILEIGECTYQDFVSKHHFNEFSMRGVNQFESGMAAAPMCNFIGKLPIGRQIWAKFRCKILYGFGVQIGPPNFVIEKKKR